MKIIVKQDTKVWINGQERKVRKGLQDIDDTVGTILVEAGEAEIANDEKESKKAKS